MSMEDVDVDSVTRPSEVNDEVFSQTSSQRSRIPQNHPLDRTYLYRGDLTSENRDLRLFYYDEYGSDLPPDFPLRLPREGLLDEIVGIVNEGVHKIFNVTDLKIPPQDNRDAGRIGERMAEITKAPRSVLAGIKGLLEKEPDLKNDPKLTLQTSSFS